MDRVGAWFEELRRNPVFLVFARAQLSLHHDVLSLGDGLRVLGEPAESACLREVGGFAPAKVGRHGCLGCGLRCKPKRRGWLLTGGAMEV